MVVFELVGHSAWTDWSSWSSRGTASSLGLFSTVEKANAKIEAIKADKEWQMTWDSFDVNPRQVA